MVELAGVFSRLAVPKILVMGDYLLDSYTIGKAGRISPEAPVPVVNVMNRENRPGGAGNVVLNLISLGAEVSVIGRIGGDEAGTILMETLAAEGISSEGFFIQPGYPTPVKNRIIADNQQVVRLDTEVIASLPEELEQQIINTLPLLLEGVNVVAISDYGKGFLSRRVLTAVIQAARERKITVIVDPKGVDFDKYKGATILKPNLKEVYAAANMPLEAPLEIVAAKVLQFSQVEILIVTRSEAGISIFKPLQERNDYPVRIREVKDVTGAGDTVLAMLAYCIGNGLEIEEAAQLANLAAGVAIERFGCARVSLSDVARHLLRFDSSYKLFKGAHLLALKQALKGRLFALLSVSECEGMTPTIFSHLLALGTRQNRDLLVFIREEEPSEEFLRILKDLNAVDFIICQGSNLEELSLALNPDEVYELNGDQLHVLHQCEV